MNETKLSFWRRRAVKRLVKHLLHDARHALHMRGDLLSGKQIESLRGAERDLQQAWKSRSTDAVTTAADNLSEEIGRAYPLRRHAKVRENLEIIVVALAVAMAFRTYFVQPFKIPTGSMQPTLYGITVNEQQGRIPMDIFPFSMIRLALFGERYVEVKAPSSGQILRRGGNEDYEFYEIRGQEPLLDLRINGYMPRHFKPGDFVSKGQVLASGRVRRGDHIFVDKVRYNFSRPKRGNIFVFSTDEIGYQRIRENSFYIKRLAGLPRETISIDPPHLVVNGKPVTEPYPFERLLTGEGYHGYALAGGYGTDALLRAPQDVIRLDKGQYLPLGDNTYHSLDGRFFGPVPEKNIVGPAFLVYWPLGNRWGRVR